MANDRPRNLTRKEKLFKTAGLFTGFVAGTIVGAGVSTTMRNAGWDYFISEVAGLACTAFYVKTFDWVSDSAIQIHRDNVAAAMKAVETAAALGSDGGKEA